MSRIEYVFTCAIWFGRGVLTAVLAHKDQPTAPAGLIEAQYQTCQKFFLEEVDRLQECRADFEKLSAERESCRSLVIDCMARVGEHQ